MAKAKNTRKVSAAARKKMSEAAKRSWRERKAGLKSLPQKRAQTRKPQRRIGAGTWQYCPHCGEGLR